VRKRATGCACPERRPLKPLPCYYAYLIDADGRIACFTLRGPREQRRRRTSSLGGKINSNYFRTGP
jgi:hypothetical protein